MGRYEELPRWKRGIIGGIIGLTFFFIFSGINNYVQLHTMLPFIMKHRHMPDNIVDAAESNSTNQVKKFLESGADPNMMDDRGWKPLFLAIENRNPEMIKLLLKYGADPKRATKGYSAYNYAISWACAPCNNDVPARTLIEYGVDVNMKDPETGFTPLHELVVDWRRPGPFQKDIALLLISKGADVNARDKKGIRPLGYAVGKDRADIAQLLKDHGAKM